MLVKFDEISDHSRIWIYQINKDLNESEELVLLDSTMGFLASWTAHGSNLKAAAKVVNHRLLIIAVDESASGASGCSIDSKMAFLRELQIKMNIDLFSRDQIFYFENESLKSMELDVFKNKIANGDLSENSIIYNTTIHTKEQLSHSFKIPVKDSWIMRMISFA